MAEATFSVDLAPLPTHAFGRRSLTWWGIIAFFLIEGTAFGLAIAAYFFLMNQERSWPPPPFLPPDLLFGTIFTVIILLSEIPNTLAKRYAEALELKPLQRMLIVVSVIGALLLIVRAFEFNALNVLWHDNAYGSVIWMLLVLHTTHIATDWVDTIVLAAMMHSRHGTEARRFVDCAENSVYWRFVWLLWLPIYGLIYWLPRLAG